MMKHTSTHRIGMLLCLLTLVGVASSLKAARSDSGLSYTFFSVRPHYHLAMPERLTMFRDRMRAREDGLGGAIEFTLFGGKSGDSCNLAQHFMPFGKISLLAQEGNDTGPPEDRDLDVEHFNVFTVNGNFESTITMRPQQTVIGLGFTWQHSFADCDGKGWWFSFSTPLTRVRNDVRFTETVAEDGGGVNTAAAANLPTDEPPVANLTDAFKQDAWSFGKIDQTKKMTKTRLADIELRLGYDSVAECSCRHGAYASVIIPTGNKPKAEFVFEPIVGHNRHVGVGFGTSTSLEIWAECDRSLWIAFDTDTKYFFKENEKRSLDLKFKPWSRYIQLYENIAEAQDAAGAGADDLFTPGINILTRDICVRPGVRTNHNAALIYNKCNMRGEVGYNFYAAQEERVKLAKTWEEGPAIKGRDGIGETNVERTINEQKEFGTPPVQAVANYNLSLITEDDLDLGSAAHPCAISHIFYASLGWHWEECREYPAFAGFGGSYEFSRTHTTLDRWLIWGKFGVSF